MNYIGFFLSYLLLFVAFIIAVILPKFKISNSITRKIVHVTISNWWIIFLIFFNDIHFVLIPPFTFLILNYFSYRFNLVKGIERDDKKEIGTIYYPLSLIILIIFSYEINKPYIGALGGLIMGYSDGLATIFGLKFGKTKLYKNKTYIGSFTMFIISFLVTFILLWIYNPVHILYYSLILSIFSTFVELFITYKGLDNLSVPLLSSLLYYLLITI